LRFRQDPHTRRVRCPERTTFARVLGGVDAQLLQRVLLLWQEQVLGPVQDPLVIIDGKEIRHADVESVSGSGRWLGSTLVPAGSNEIPAGRQRLAQLDLVEASALDASIDLLFSRHMMIHLTVTDNLKVLENIENSGVRYFMATTFLTNSGDDPINVNTNDFRLVLGNEINLMQPPYCLRPPIKLFLDASHDDVNSFSYMGLWDITMKPFRRESC